MQIEKTEVETIIKKHENHIRTEIFMQNVECVNHFNMISKDTLNYVNSFVSENTAVLLNFDGGNEGVIKMTSFMDLTPDSIRNCIRIDEKVSSLSELKAIIIKKITEKNSFY